MSDHPRFLAARRPCAWGPAQGCSSTGWRCWTLRWLAAAPTFSRSCSSPRARWASPGLARALPIGSGRPQARVSLGGQVPSVPSQSPRPASSGHRRDGRGAVGHYGPRSLQGAGGRVGACSPEEGRGRSPHQGPSGPGKMKKLTGRPGRGCVALPRSCPVLAGLHFRGCGSPSCTHSAARVSPFLRGGFTSQR